MDTEKRYILQQKLNTFLSLSTEEKHSIDSDNSLDGLFHTIQEMSDVVETSREYKEGEENGGIELA